MNEPCTCGCNIPQVLADDDGVSTSALEGARAKRHWLEPGVSASRAARFETRPGLPTNEGQHDCVGDVCAFPRRRTRGSAWGADVHLCVVLRHSRCTQTIRLAFLACYARLLRNVPSLRRTTSDDTTRRINILPTPAPAYTVDHLARLEKSLFENVGSSYLLISASAN
jgi:hypothetical protein